VDTSFFASIGAVNPGLTAMANAILVGEHIAERLHASVGSLRMRSWSSEVGLIYVIGSSRAGAGHVSGGQLHLTSPHGFGFSVALRDDVRPASVLAILASSLGPRLARRWTLKRVLQAGLAADLLAMALLAASRLLVDVSGAAYGVLLVATGSLGFGFGAAVMAMNTYAQKLSPGREDRSVLALNALLGAGTALAPLFVAIFIGVGAWWLMPVVVGAALAGLLFASTMTQLDVPAVATAGASRTGRLPRRFWLFASGGVSL
jgi:MFS family permease